MIMGDLKILVIKIFNPSILLFCKNGSSIINSINVMIRHLFYFLRQLLLIIIISMNYYS